MISAMRITTTIEPVMTAIIWAARALLVQALVTYVTKYVLLIAL